MSHAWETLEPSHALAAGDARYVPRPWGGGDRLAVLLNAGMSPIAVTGAPGSGKSSELARAAVSLAPTISMSLSIDRLVDLSDPTPAQVVFAVAEAMLDKLVADYPDVVPSKQLTIDVRASDPTLGRGAGRRMEPADLLWMVHGEICRLLRTDRIILLIDGLDRADVRIARTAVQAFGDVAQVVALALVVDPRLANGPDSRELLHRYRVFTLPSLPSRAGATGKAGRKFLLELLRVRLGVAKLPAELVAVAERAADRSGGIPRMFLQLMADAAGFGAIGGVGEPTEESLDDACRDQADALRRLLRDGDLAALAAAKGTDGLEVDVERRVRFLSEGLLLEYPDGEDSFVEPHPLLGRLMLRRETAKNAKAAKKRAPAKRAPKVTP